MKIPIDYEYCGDVYCDHCDHLGAYIVDDENICSRCLGEQNCWEEPDGWDCGVYDEV